jgi:hypothetical protein
VPAEGGYDVQLLKQSQSFRAARLSCRRVVRSSGFTTLRDMGTEGAVTAMSASNRRRGGLHTGPRLFVCTLAISSTGGSAGELCPELTLPKECS